MFHLQCHRACARVIPASGHEFGIRIIDRNRSRAGESATNSDPATSQHDNERLAASKKVPFRAR